jgi:hypothetical protein
MNKDTVQDPETSSNQNWHEVAIEIGNCDPNTLSLGFLKIVLKLLAWRSMTDEIHKKKKHLLISILKEMELNFS